MATFGGKYDILVILKDHSGDPGADPNGDFDITDKVITGEYEDGSPQSVVLTLNTRYGLYHTVAPKIQHFDRIYVRVTDATSGTNVIEDVFHVRRISRPQKNGLKMKLFCPHQSSNLWTKTISFRKKRVSNNAAVVEWVNQLNGNNKGTSDPTVEIPTFDSVTKVGNRFSTNTVNDHIYEDQKARTVMDEIIDKELQPPEGGGSFEPMFVRFKSKYNHSTGADLDTVQLQAFEQGFKDNSGSFTNVPSLTLEQNTLESGTFSNVHGLESEEDPEQSTNLRVICDKISGTFPREQMLFQGAKEAFRAGLQNIWVSGNDYKEGHLVSDSGTVYECISDHTSSGANQPPNASFWIVRTFTKPAAWATSTSYSKNDLVRHQDIAYKALQAHTSSSSNEPGKDPDFWVRVVFVPTVDYSPLTKDKVQYWVNALGGAKHAATDNGKTVWVDPSVAIKDSLHPREPVDYVNTDPSLIPNELKIDFGSGNQIPDAFRMLVINPTTGAETGAGDFSGSDDAGITFAGNIAEYFDPDHDGTGVWRVFQGRITADDFEVYDWYESDSWIKNPCTSDYVDSTGACKLLSGSAGTRATVWTKGAYTLTEIPLVGKAGAFQANRQFECVHSIKWDSGNSRVDMGNESIMDELGNATSGVFIKSAPLDLTNNPFAQGIGFNFHSRWPRTSNAIPFGAVTAGEKLKVSPFDMFNMFLTHLGVSEWFGPGVEDYYPIQGWKFSQKFTATHSLFGLFDLEGGYSFGLWMMDRNSNMKIIDYEHERNDSTIQPEPGLGAAKPFLGVPGNSVFFAAQEPELIDVFDPSEFLMGGIYTKDSFDQQGRWLGARSRFNLMSEIKLSVDGWVMTKPLVVTNVDEPNNKPARNIEGTAVKAPGIITYAQAKNLVLGLERLANFKRRKFVIETKPKFNAKYGDPIYYKNTRAIDETTDTFANTIRAVVNKNIITFSKPKSTGPGSLSHKIEIITRIWP